MSPLQSNRPTIVVTDDDLFSDPAPHFELKNFENLVDFSHISAADVLGLLGRFGDWLDQFPEHGDL